jgi:hypothetical protein
LAWLSPNKAQALELHDHLVNRWCGDAEETLKVDLGRRLPVQ